MVWRVGGQVSKEQMERVLSYIKSGEAEGARLETGGRRWGDKGFFVEPTVFTGVQDHMKIAREEVFGPVQCILSWSSLDEVPPSFLLLLLHILFLPLVRSLLQRLLRILLLLILSILLLLLVHILLLLILHMLLLSSLLTPRLTHSSPFPHSLPPASSPPSTSPQNPTRVSRPPSVLLRQPTDTFVRDARLLAELEAWWRENDLTEHFEEGGGYGAGFEEGQRYPIWAGSWRDY